MNEGRKEGLCECECESECEYESESDDKFEIQRACVRAREV